MRDNIHFQRVELHLYTFIGGKRLENTVTVKIAIDFEIKLRINFISSF